VINQQNKPNKPRVLFLSHGGGPMPLLGDEGHKEMVACLKQITTHITKPSAIIIISAHWEESIATITSGESPSLIYDYYGFPKASYDLKYPCQGKPLLANQIHNLLEKSGIPSAVDAIRGFDHGLFVPLTIMYPDADIPCVQLSLMNNLNAAEHIKMGQALQELDYDNLLIIGSGFSFHNMRAFFTAETSESKKLNESFENWLLTILSSPDIDEEQRKQSLINWENASGEILSSPRRAFITTACLLWHRRQSLYGVVRAKNHE